MRITNSMLTSNSVWNLNKNLQRLSQAQQTMASQSNIQLPSDDPVIATRAIKYRNYVSNVEQYQKNTEDATAWMKVTESAIGELTDVLKRIRELTVNGANDATLAASDKEAILTEVSQLKESVVDIMNTSYAGRYVFGGYSTDSPPYEIVSTDVGDKVMFKGSYLSLGGPVSESADLTAFCEANAGQSYSGEEKQTIRYNVGFGSQMAVNVEGQDVIGKETGLNLFDSIDKLLLALGGETSYQTAEITDGSPPVVTTTTHELNTSALLDDFDADLDRISAARASLGARMNVASMRSDRLASDEITYNELMSNNEDADVAQASIDVSTAQAVYQASLSVSAKVMSKSLVDYLS
ncbi:flagellar hook-associated protein FlgL|uniref:Flagellar hook-associated protein 3 FlgL n=1 Tax=Dendrosporobacter quercicolus TaxID=146817 RepID=A0A1G9VTW5_9FIRM|nr:flagellar hook-associated protein FlgL [Dendrosporobacter quercicolus]NSL47800.1 flagellar hook-associated protein FlgL [Dendrosporobacter quercicolus DSM 1736]SDM75678.1 flagellar hook-associated protein 3 FlgL [Dendrosporobacter quercicolus]